MVEENEENMLPELKIESGDSKNEIRTKVWNYLEDNRLASYPRPAFRRVTNFKGAEAAANKLANIDVFKAARNIRCDPDTPLQQIRFKTLQAGKKLFVPSPGHRNHVLSCISRSTDMNRRQIRMCCSRQGVLEFGSPVDIEDHVDIDVVVVGCIAVSPKGWRIGKGAGLSDLEYAMSLSTGAIGNNVPVVTIVHDCQIVDLPDTLFQSHDVPVDYIVTPTRVIKCADEISPGDTVPPKPVGLIWSLITPKVLRRVPVLQRLRYREWKSGKDVRLSGETENPAELCDVQLELDGKGSSGDSVKPTRRRRFSSRRRSQGKHDVKQNDTTEPMEVEELVERHENTGVKPSSENDSRRKYGYKQQRRNRDSRKNSYYESDDNNARENGTGRENDKVRENSTAKENGKARDNGSVRENGNAREDSKPRDNGKVRENRKARDNGEVRENGRKRGDHASSKNKENSLDSKQLVAAVEAGDGQALKNKSDGEAGKSENKRRERPWWSRRRRPDCEGSVYVGSLPRRTRVSEFKTEVRERKVYPVSVLWRGEIGFAFLNFRTIIDAETALESLSGLQVQKKYVRLEMAHGVRRDKASVSPDGRNGNGRENDEEEATATNGNRRSNGQSSNVRRRRKRPSNKKTNGEEQNTAARRGGKKASVGRNSTSEAIDSHSDGRSSFDSSVSHTTVSSEVIDKDGHRVVNSLSRDSLDGPVSCDQTSVVADQSAAAAAAAAAAGGGEECKGSSSTGVSSLDVAIVSETEQQQTVDTVQVELLAGDSIDDAVGLDSVGEQVVDRSSIYVVEKTSVEPVVDSSSVVLLDQLQLENMDIQNGKKNALLISVCEISESDNKSCLKIDSGDGWKVKELEMAKSIDGKLETKPGDEVVTCVEAIHCAVVDHTVSGSSTVDSEPSVIDHTLSGSSTVDADSERSVVDHTVSGSSTVDADSERSVVDHTVSGSSTVDSEPSVVDHTVSGSSTVDSEPSVVDHTVNGSSTVDSERSVVNRMATDEDKLVGLAQQEDGGKVESDSAVEQGGDGETEEGQKAELVDGGSGTGIVDGINGKLVVSGEDDETNNNIDIDDSDDPLAIDIADHPDTPPLCDLAPADRSDTPPPCCLVQADRPDTPPLCGLVPADRSAADHPDTPPPCCLVQADRPDTPPLCGLVPSEAPPTVAAS